jgi:hypothetical protein
VFTFKNIIKLSKELENQTELMEGNYSTDNQINIGPIGSDSALQSTQSFIGRSFTAEQARNIFPSAQQAQIIQGSEFYA